MSLPDAAPANAAGRSTPSHARPARPTRPVIAWCAAAGVLLAAAGVLRSVQAARHQVDKGFQAKSPFPLKEIPRVVGEWKVPDNSEETLDDQTLRITGSTDYVIWKYKDELTGTQLSILVLYGPAEPVVPHTPQVCYPATGYQPIGPPADKQVKYGKDKVATFRASEFVKTGGRDVIRSVVYHSFRLDGEWSPGIASRRFPRRSPGVFKVQIQRRAVNSEGSLESSEPIEQFLRAFLPVLEAKVEQSARAAATVAAR